MKKFKVVKSYTFYCTWEIQCDSEEEAQRIANEDCAAIKPNYHTSNSNANCDDGDIHPSMEQTTGIAEIK